MIAFRGDRARCKFFTRFSFEYENFIARRSSFRCSRDGEAARAALLPVGVTREFAHENNRGNKDLKGKRREGPEKPDAARFVSVRVGQAVVNIPRHQRLPACYVNRRAGSKLWKTFLRCTRVECP